MPTLIQKNVPRKTIDLCVFSEIKDRICIILPTSDENSINKCKVLIELLEKDFEVKIDLCTNKPNEGDISRQDLKTQLDTFGFIVKIELQRDGCPIDMFVKDNFDPTTYNAYQQKLS